MAAARGAGFGPGALRVAAVVVLVAAFAISGRAPHSGRTVTEHVRTRHHRPDGSPRYTNRLVRESSPYLRQHAHNPVDWYPWGGEAFARARAENKPVFLSIGYSTCHWCHVMERESFDDVDVAELLNRRYVAIKVDREQRPDLDAIYMTAVQAMGVGGGWPLTVWLTPDGRPFYGGTYYPPRGGTRGFRVGLIELLERLDRAWRDDPGQVAAAAADVVGRLERASASPAAGDLPDATVLRTAHTQLATAFDPEHGGFGTTRKFPEVPALAFLLRYHRRTGDAAARAMVERTLEHMAAGGIHDQLAGGFHRYTMDRAWQAPHFEKMLYDNALLAALYLEASQATGRRDFAEVARRTLAWMARDMAAPRGGFCAAMDAESEEEEGRFYRWTPEEVAAALDPPGTRLAAAYFGIAPDSGVPHVSTPLAEAAAATGVPADEAPRVLEAARARLLAARSRRVAPFTDCKVVVAWNGLAISAFARAAQALGEPAWVEPARRAAEAILAHGRDGRVPRSLIDGAPHGRGYLEDHAFLEAGLLDLFEATGEPGWLDRAVALQHVLDRRFTDPAGGYFRTPDDGERLLVRDKPDFDGSEPSGNSVALANLLRLHELTGDDAWRLRAERLLRGQGAALARAPRGLLAMLCGVERFLDRPKEIVVVTPPGGSAGHLLEVLRTRFVPNRSLVVVADGGPRDALAARVPLVAEKTTLGGKATAYVCERQVCQRPTTDPETLGRELDRVAPLP